MFGSKDYIKEAADDQTASATKGESSSPPNQSTLSAEKLAGRTVKPKVSKARELIQSAKQTFSRDLPSDNEERSFRVIIREDPDIQSPGSHNNSAGESKPGPKTTFRVGVTEDKNKKCRRTMEDTHSYLYNFLPPVSSTNLSTRSGDSGAVSDEPTESDNGYFAIFDGHAGTYAADWCGRKLHVILEETIRKHPNTPIPELLDMTFTNCDGQLEKLPVKNSGCTAVCALLRWEDRPVSAGSPSAEKNGAGEATPTPAEIEKPGGQSTQAHRQRILYTANVGDARIVLCRHGKALRLSYDHKGSDENEGKRVANAGGLILNNRVNGVLAVTRALGDSYMKDLVTGHPYTTETVLRDNADEFLILACDGLWDVCSDQEAVDLVRHVPDPQEASEMLVDYALSRFSSDNLSCMIVRFDPTGRFEDIDKVVRNKETETKDSLDGEATAVGNSTIKDDEIKLAHPPVGERTETVG